MEGETVSIRDEAMNITIRNLYNDEVAFKINFHKDIQVGDIVVYGCDNIKAAVIDSTENKFIVFDENGCVYSIEKEEVKPIGEYTDLVEALMLKVQHTHTEDMA